MITKRILAILMALLFVLSVVACGAKPAKPEAEEPSFIPLEQTGATEVSDEPEQWNVFDYATEHVENVEGIVTTQSDSDTAKKEQAYCDSFGITYDELEAEMFFRHATQSKKDDWYMNPDFPEKLYSYDRNCYSVAILDMPIGELTSKQTLSYYDEATLREVVEYARNYILSVYDYRDTSEHDIQKYGMPAYGELLADADVKKMVSEEGYKAEAAFVTDCSLVYKPSHGFFRVRGRLYLKQTGDESERVVSLPKGEWYYQDVEMLISPVSNFVDTFAEQTGIKPWDAKYAVFEIFEFAPWQQATKKDEALLKNYR